MVWRLQQLAERYGLQKIGAADPEIRGVCAIEAGAPDQLSFVSNPKYRAHLASTRAGAVVLSPTLAKDYAGPALVAKDPYLAFARIARLFDTEAGFAPGLAPTAVVDSTAVIGAGAGVAAHCVIGARVQLGDGAYVGPGSIIEADAVIGARTRIEARVHIARRSRIGADCRLHPGVVIGSRGFGLARGPDGWEDVPQLGAVRIGDRVEIGANTTIDRGALGDTVIGDGVKLDNQIQIAHNVQIGRDTAIAACVGISGSTRIGARCMIAGGVGIAGHIEIGDDVVVQGWTMVTRSLNGPGQYGSGWPVESVREWRRQVARLRRLDRVDARLRQLEQALGLNDGGAADDAADT